MSGYATRRALYGKMAGDGTLTALLHAPPTGHGQNIFYQQAPGEADYPLVIFSKQAGTPRYAFDSTPAFNNEVWLVKGVSEGSTADRADEIADRLDTLLTDGVITVSGATLCYLRRESDVDYAEDYKGRQFRHAGSLYRLITSPT